MDRSVSRKWRRCFKLSDGDIGIIPTLHTGELSPIHELSDLQAPYTPEHLPELVVERVSCSARKRRCEWEREDETEQFYEQLAKRMRKYYRKLFNIPKKAKDSDELDIDQDSSDLDMAEMMKLDPSLDPSAYNIGFDVTGVRETTTEEPEQNRAMTQSENISGQELSGISATFTVDDINDANNNNIRARQRSADSTSIEDAGILHYTVKALVHDPPKRRNTVGTTRYSNSRDTSERSRKRIRLEKTSDDLNKRTVVHDASKGADSSASSNKTSSEKTSDVFNKATVITDDLSSGQSLVARTTASEGSGPGTTILLTSDETDDDIESKSQAEEGSYVFARVAQRGHKRKLTSPETSSKSDTSATDGEGYWENVTVRRRPVKGSTRGDSSVDEDVIEQYVEDGKESSIGDRDETAEDINNNSGNNKNQGAAGSAHCDAPSEHSEQRSSISATPNIAAGQSPGSPSTVEYIGGQQAEDLQPTQHELGLGAHTDGSDEFEISFRRSTSGLYRLGTIPEDAESELVTTGDGDEKESVLVTTGDGDAEETGAVHDLEANEIEVMRREQSMELRQILPPLYLLRNALEGIKAAETVKSPELPTRKHSLLNVSMTAIDTIFEHLRGSPRAPTNKLASDDSFYNVFTNQISPFDYLFLPCEVSSPARKRSSNDDVFHNFLSKRIRTANVDASAEKPELEMTQTETAFDAEFEHPEHETEREDKEARTGEAGTQTDDAPCENRDQTNNRFEVDHQYYYSDGNVTCGFTFKKQ